jgi:para-nitrobenzyl esterase
VKWKRVVLLGLQGAVLVLLASLAVAAPAAAGRDPAVVVTDKGAVRGTVTMQGREFHRIPFAASPVGEWRWRAPQPAAAWSGIRDATVPGPACAQIGGPGQGTPRSTAEDCLHLNVYTPRAGMRHRPVMVWFHGGSYAFGSANDYDGSALARRGVVVVTVNYRLGPFGYLAHPVLSAEDPRAGSGNYGTLDQQAALRWVRANARAFGGDPRRVTAFGESAGAGSVCAQLTSPRAAGLFGRAILQSGPCSYRTWAGAEATGRRFATSAGCQDATDVAACLRARPARAVLDAVGGAVEGIDLAWAPTSETPVLPLAPDRAIAAGAYHRMPVLAGTTLDEGRIFAAFLEASGVPLDETTYPAVLAEVYGPDAGRVQELYPASAYGGDHRLALGAVFTDDLFACPTWTLNRSLATSTRLFAYEFADRTAPNLFTVEPDFPLGAYHGSELPYLFPFEAIPLDATQRRLSAQMLSYWARFAAGGDPNGHGTPTWRAFRLTAPAVLTLDLPPGTANGYDFGTRHRCDFWATVESRPTGIPVSSTRIG